MATTVRSTDVLPPSAAAAPPHLGPTAAPEGKASRPARWAWPNIAPLAADLLLVALSGLVVIYLRFQAQWNLRDGGLLWHDLGFLALYAVLIAIFCGSQGLYSTMRRGGALDDGFSVLKAIFYATLFLTAFIYLSGDKSISRLVVGFTGLLSAVTLPAWRLWKREIVRQQVSTGQEGRNVLIVGAGNTGQALARHLDEHKHLGYVVKGFLDGDGNGLARVLGKVEDLHRLALVNFVDEVFVTVPSEKETVAQVMIEARRHHFDVAVVPELFDGVGWRVPIRYVGDFPVMELLREPIPAFGLFLKRMIDVSGAMLGLGLLSPVLALTATVIKLESRGPILYRSARVGKKHRKFTCYKLRTMVADAERLKENLLHLNERKGPLFKIHNDPRVTRVGRFLRRYSLDELPQLWNVLRGQMSLVGPRPPTPDEVQQYSPEELRRLDVKPGITGLWQTSARRDPEFNRALALDLEYIENWSLRLDTKILFKTSFEVLRGSGS